MKLGKYVEFNHYIRYRDLMLWAVDDFTYERHVGTVNPVRIVLTFVESDSFII